MKTTLKAVIAAALVTGIAPVAHADLDLDGVVGTINFPTAQIPARGAARVQADYQKFPNSLGGGHYIAAHAAGRVSDNIELNGGLGRNSFGAGGGTATQFDLGGKYLFTRESDPVGVRIAAGLGYSHVGGVVGLKNYNGYVVGSKYLGAVSGKHEPVIGHLGLKYDRFTFNGGGPNSSQASIYAGVEVPVSAKGDWSLVGDVGSKNIKGGKSIWGAGVRFRPENRGFSIAAGARDQGFAGGGSALFVAVGYTFETEQLTGK